MSSLVVTPMSSLDVSAWYPWYERACHEDWLWVT